MEEGGIMLAVSVLFYQESKYGSGTTPPHQYTSTCVHWLITWSPLARREGGKASICLGPFTLQTKSRPVRKKEESM